MKVVLNPFTGELQLIGSSSSGGGITGPVSSTDKAIVRWNGTNGSVVEDSLAIVQDGGAIEAQAFITMRSVTNPVVINPGESWIAPSIEIAPTGSVVISSDGDLVIV